MNRKWTALPLLALIAGTLSAASGVSVISGNSAIGAWVGYDDGVVRFCNGGGGTAVPFWTRCTTAIKATGAAVTDISNNEGRAWIGHADGQLHYCKESGSDQQPTTECVAVKP